MSAITYTVFDTVVLTTSAATIYTIPATVGTIGRNIQFIVTNITAGALTVTFYRVPSAGSASDANAFAKSLSVPANDYIILDVPRLEAGDFIQGLASANTSINVNPYRGDEYIA